jgi:hypothetical protein
MARSANPSCIYWIEFCPRADSAPILNFYMGKNTPERKDYIMDSLVVPVEE